VAVNVSGRQFQGGKLVESVARALRHAGLEPDLLELEITEGVLMVMTTEVRRALDGLRELGVHLAIDDFGTGYSSLSYLKHLPIGILKIDRSFVRGIPESRDDVQIATTIVTMAHGPGRAVVAEGIETAAQRDLLRANGCRCGQGYLFARPLAVANLDAWLAGESARVARG
jgi:EAL domain-containing protein (putative c-di-GMP-specific phosphodiesterase class I)